MTVFNASYCHLHYRKYTFRVFGIFHTIDFRTRFVHYFSATLCNGFSKGVIGLADIFLDDRPVLI